MRPDPSSLPTSGTLKPSGGSPRSHASPLPYRPDIDGLRALAVVPVVLYHAGIPGLPGGFVGVDVFFVISGYLITRIIGSALEAGTFSIIEFYERRIRRIIPALMAVMAVCFAATLLTFLPDDLENFARSAMSAALFSSNIYFFPRSNYFATATMFKPLLHTWSLGVEEQFYLVYPWILVAVARWMPRWLLAVLIGIAIASFVASALMLLRSHNAVFYLAPYRAWELFLGGIVAVGTPRLMLGIVWRTIIGTAGLAAIVYPVLTYDSEMTFPGPAALPPCAGAALLLLAGQMGSNPVSAILAMRAPRFIGLISYSLYLWHWPIIVLYQYNRDPADTSGSGPWLVLASLVAGILSWRFIEQPFRGRSAVRSRRGVFAWGAAATAAVLALGGLSVLSGGLPGRFPQVQAGMVALQGTYNPNRSRCSVDDVANGTMSPDCIYGDKSASPTFAVWGDSHGTELVHALGDMLAGRGLSILQMTLTQCPPALDFYIIWRRTCPAKNEAVLQFLLDHPQIDHVILAAHYSIYAGSDFDAFTRGFERAVKRLLDAGKTVTLVYPTPESGRSIPHLAALYLLRGMDPATITISRADYDGDNAMTIQFLDRLEGPKLFRIRPAEALCDAQACRTIQDGKLLYYDADHLDSYGARLVASLFRPLLTQP